MKKLLILFSILSLSYFGSAQNSLISVINVLNHCEKSLKKEYKTKDLRVFEKNRNYILIEINDSILYQNNINNLSNLSLTIASQLIILSEQKNTKFLNAYNDIMVSFISKKGVVSKVLFKKVYDIKELKQ